MKKILRYVPLIVLYCGGLYTQQLSAAEQMGLQLSASISDWLERVSNQELHYETVIHDINEKGKKVLAATQSEVININAGKIYYSRDHLDSIENKLSKIIYAFDGKLANYLDPSGKLYISNNLKALPFDPKSEMSLLIPINPLVEQKTFTIVDALAGLIKQEHFRDITIIKQNASYVLSTFNRATNERVIFQMPESSYLSRQFKFIKDYETGLNVSFDMVFKESTSGQILYPESINIVHLYDGKPTRIINTKIKLVKDSTQDAAYYQVDPNQAESIYDVDLGVRIKEFEGKSARKKGWKPNL